MAEAMVVSGNPVPILPTDYDSGLAVPPLDTAFLYQQLNDNDDVIGDNRNDVVVGDLDLDDFDFDIDDFDIPSAEDLDDLFDPTLLPEFDCQAEYDANFSQFVPNVDQFDSVFNAASSDLLGDDKFSGDRSSHGSGVLNSDLKSDKISRDLNVPSPESNGSNREASENGGGDVKVMDWPSPESRGSGNFGSNVSDESNNCVTKSVRSSRISNKSSSRVRIVNKKIEVSENNVNSSLLKRKKDSEDLLNSTTEFRISKCKKSNSNSENNNSGGDEKDEKRKARLVRNRESAQLSRQRKKHYVDELEEKVKMMHSTIQDLNAKVNFFMAENTTLRQQMGGGGAAAAVPPPPMVPGHPGMYPHPSMVYPWMPYAPPYMMKQGSQVPLVPIPRLKPLPKVKPKIKKVAGVSFLGLLFFVLLFGGLAPMVNMRYGGVREALTGGESYGSGGFNEKHQGRVLMVNGSEKYGGKRDFGRKSSLYCGDDSGGRSGVDEFVQLGNASEPLVASLYLPRNDKLVKIDGNLIIHSVLASEKSMSNGGGETGLAVPGDLGQSRRNDVGHPPKLRALGSSSTRMDSRDGRLQQWFREGFAGPMLSSGMCTEVFQFDVSSASAASGAILPAPTTRNISEGQNQNSTHANKGRNRRILRGLPIPLPNSSHNISEQRKSEQGNLKGNSSASPMVVSVLVDPREVGDADVDGVMGTKSISRIFVVVLIDSVKYATYSCMLPFVGSAPHLVTT